MASNPPSDDTYIRAYQALTVAGEHATVTSFKFRFVDKLSALFNQLGIARSPHEHTFLTHILSCAIITPRNTLGAFGRLTNIYQGHEARIIVLRNAAQGKESFQVALTLESSTGSGQVWYEVLKGEARTTEAAAEQSLVRMIRELGENRVRETLQAVGGGS